MEEFPSNSIEQSTTPKIRRPMPSDDAPEVQSPAGGEKVIKKIVKGGGAIKRKRTMGRRVREIFGLEDDRKGVVESVIQDVLGPALRDAIADTITQTVERMIYGEAQHTTRRNVNRRGPIGSSNHISYNRYSTTPRETAGPRMSPRGRASHDFGEIELRTRAQAEATIAQMQEFIDRFGHTSVADLYEMVDLDAEFTDEKWGWTDLYGADVRRTRSGTYILILPRTEPIG
ncbi:hypothetical protein SEA_BILO_36 [Streptomyces phage Bilo]|nr:hypothetical protein SEA_BILO_36 [Streptomyces phage Bilo]